MVGPSQVVAQGVGASVRPVPIGAGQQIVDKIPPQMEFDLGDGPLVGKFQGQNDTALAQGRQVVLGHRVVRIVQREDTEDLGPRLDESEYPRPDSCLTGLYGQLVEQESALVRELFGVGVGLSGSGRAAQVAELILDTHRMPRQVIECISDTLSTVPSGQRGAQYLVHVRLPL